MATKDQLTAIVRNAGLTENEAKVYVASLSLGPTTVLAMSKAAGVKRTTIYDILMRLKEAGLVREEVFGLKTKYVSEPPERLQQFAHARAEALSRHMSELSSLFNLKGGESVIKYYEGLSAIKPLYTDILREIRPGDFYYAISDVAEWLDLDRKFFENFLRERAKVRLDLRVLAKASVAAAKMPQLTLGSAQVKGIAGEAAFHTNVVIVPKRVIFHSLEEPMVALVVENPNIVMFQRTMFELMWGSIPEAY